MLDYIYQGNDTENTFKNHPFSLKILRLPYIHVCEVVMDPGCPYMLLNM